MSDWIWGIDLAGPRNYQDTGCAICRPGRKELKCVRLTVGVSDGQILEWVRETAPRDGVWIGIDAPLSYQPGGGDRRIDRELRKHAVSAGLAPGSVMPPTLTRMAYLTLRAVCLARAIQIVRPDACIVEVHPWVGLALRRADAQQVRHARANADARRWLLRWLWKRGLRGLTGHRSVSVHELAACAAAWIVWQWKRGAALWVNPPEKPLHPFHFVC